MNQNAYLDDFGMLRTPYRPILPSEDPRGFQYQQMMMQGQPILLPRPVGFGREEIRDMEYWKSMYPASMKRLQILVEEGCDRMDYSGSPIYDEFPDQVMVRRLCGEILERTMEDEEIMADWGEETELESTARRRHPRLSDLIEVLVVNELFHRRARRRCCGRRFY